MNRILSFTLAVFLSLSIFFITASADNPKVTSKNLEIHKSEEIILSFEISKKSEIAAVQFDLTYNSKVFTFVDYGYGNVFKDGFTAGNNRGDENNTGIGIFSYGYISTENVNISGEMFNVAFKTADTVKPGEKYEFKLTCIDASKMEGEKITPITIDPITVTATVKEGSAPSNTASINNSDASLTGSTTSRIVGETSLTNEAQSEIASPTNTNNSNSDDKDEKHPAIIYILIIVLSLVIIASVIVIVLIVVKKTHNVSEDDDMKKIISQDSFENEFDEFDE